MTIALRSAPALRSLKAEAGAALPTRFKVLGWGANQTSEGVVIVDEVTAKVFSANQKRIGRERVALDYEHNTVPGTREYERTQEPRAIAGNLNLTCVPGEGIFAEAATYTASGTRSATDFEDVSLAPFLDADNRVVAAHSVALTRTGATYGIHFQPADPAALSVAEQTILGEIKILSAGTTPAASTQPNPKPMSEKFLALAAVASLVGLSADADEAAVLAKLKTQLTPAAPVDLAPLQAQITALAARIPAAVDLAPLSAQITALESKLKANTDAATVTEKTRLVTLMARDGKLPLNPVTRKAYTAEELKALDLPTLQLLEANTAVTVPLSARNVTLGEKAQDAGLKGRDRTIAAFEKQIATAKRN